MSANPPSSVPARGATRWVRPFRLGLHAALSGALVVAYFSGDEDTYAMHLAAGYLLLLALTARLGAGLGLPGLPALPWPRLTSLSSLVRQPAVLLPWLALALLVTAAAAGLSGVIADRLPHNPLGHAHQALGELVLYVALAHVAWHGLLQLRRLAVSAPRPSRVAPMLLALGLATAAAGTTLPALAGAEQQVVLQDLLTQARQADPGFSGFSAERGKALYFERHPESKYEAKSCADCHTADPTRPGQHAKTGRAIDPMAAWVNPERFTDPAKVEKRFSRDCPSVLGRDCSARDKGDFITFLSTPVTP